MTSSARIEQFNSTWRNIESVYEDYARRIGMTYTSMHIFNLIAVTEDCTQSMLCERTRLPKQSVNAVVTQFYKQGLIELREVPSDRRNKTIHLTSQGEEFSKRYIEHIMAAEKQAMKSLEDAESEQLVSSMKSYEREFRAALLGAER